MELKGKNLLIGLLVAVVFLMAVGYAAFANQLQINGTTEINSKWDVHIESITPGTKEGGTITGNAKNIFAKVEDRNLKASFKAEFTSPGDSISYKVRVVNGGTLPAKLTNISFTDDEIDQDDAIVYTYSGITKGSVLGIQSNDNFIEFTVTATYKDVIEGQSQPSSDKLEKEASLILTYNQA